MTLTVRHDADRVACIYLLDSNRPYDGRAWVSYEKALEASREGLAASWRVEQDDAPLRMTGVEPMGREALSELQATQPPHRRAVGGWMYANGEAWSVVLEVSTA